MPYPVFTNAVIEALQNQVTSLAKDLVTIRSRLHQEITDEFTRITDIAVGDVIVVNGDRYPHGTRMKVEQIEVNIGYFTTIQLHCARQNKDGYFGRSNTSFTYYQDQVTKLCA